MKVITATNVNQALWFLMRDLKIEGIERPSRAGQTIEFPTPVTTCYKRPVERVLFSPERDANPFFHLMEALWMLAGRNDLNFVAHYNRRMATFSDDGQTLRGTYGYRWRNWFDIDQLVTVINLLRSHSNSRRAIIQMWDATADLNSHEDLRDVPCNTTIAVQLVGGYDKKLDMTVFCRSNDLIWGLAGANVVHFSVLQEYLASNIGCPVGTLYQVSNNLHAYVDVFEGLLEKEYLAKDPTDPYITENTITSDVIISDPSSFDDELVLFLENIIPSKNWKNPFFPSVAIPMQLAYDVFRQPVGRDREEIYDEMLELLNKNLESDWLLAARQWTERRRQLYLTRNYQEGIEKDD